MAQGAPRPEPDLALQRSALQLEGSGRVRFTLNEEEDDTGVQDVQPLLSGGGSGGGSSAFSAVESGKRQVLRTVSRPTLAAEEEADSWAHYRHEAGR